MQDEAVLKSLPHVSEHLERDDTVLVRLVDLCAPYSVRWKTKKLLLIAEALGLTEFLSSWFCNKYREETLDSTYDMSLYSVCTEGYFIAVWKRYRKGIQLGCQFGRVFKNGKIEFYTEDTLIEYLKRKIT